MQDTYGDGWNGATLEVLINNVSVGIYSATDYGSVVNVAICNGETINLIYSPGNYENENSYVLQDYSWNILHQNGPNPNTGFVFSSVGDCETPLLQGSHPCTAIPIDAIDCLTANNTGYPGSGFNPNCAAFQGSDIWFSMVIPASGNLSFETLSGSLNDTGLAVWTGNICSNVQSLGCDDDGGMDYYSYLMLYDLTPGDSIYIQVFGYGGGTGSFEICVNDLGTVSFISSELPIVLINTQNQAIVQNSKINCLMEIKYNGVGNITYVDDAPNIYNGNIGISIRGASSSGYPQKPFSVETRTSTGENNNVPILGMPDENDWVLLSNYNDRSLVKNIMSQNLFGLMGNYSPLMQLCEVLIDSSYQGIYVIGEKIKRDINRVNIANLTPADTMGDQLSGGYILQQNYYNNNNSFQSNYSPIDHPTFDIHFVYEYPDEFAIQPAQKIYIASFVDSLETALYSPDFADPINGYRKYLDVSSFIDYFLVNELARNADGFKKSVFFNKDKYSNGGKLKAGPVWDFDWAWKNLATGCAIYSGYSGGGWAHLNNDCFTDNYSSGWYVRLLQDSTFANELRCTYESYRQTMFDTTYLFSYIDSIGDLVINAEARHFQKWPILGMSGPAPDFGPVATTYLAELDSLKSWIITRINWLDSNIPGFCSSASLIESNILSDVNCYPNPANNYLTIDYSLPSDMFVSVSVCNYLGAEVLINSIGTQSTGQHSFSLDTESLAPGVYILKIQRGTDVMSKKIIVMR